MAVQEELNVVLANNVDAFYKYVNNCISYHKGIVTLIGNHGAHVYSDYDKAVMFNEYFGVTVNGGIPGCDNAILNT